jgi:hypothetical protein
MIKVNQNFNPFRLYYQLLIVYNYQIIVDILTYN